MPTTIYESSLLTQRKQFKTESVSFQNRLNTQSTPNTTSYGPRLGVYDQSIVNDVKQGNMPYYRKNDGGCTTIDNGCPCADSNLNN